MRRKNSNAVSACRKAYWQKCSFMFARFFFYILTRAAKSALHCRRCCLRCPEKEKFFIFFFGKKHFCFGGSFLGGLTEAVNSLTGGGEVAFYNIDRRHKYKKEKVFVGMFFLPSTSSFFCALHAPF